jgi:hypothetical protein
MMCWVLMEKAIQTAVRITNLGPGKVKIRRSSLKPYKPPQELAILRAGDVKDFDCEDIADLLVEKL